MDNCLTCLYEPDWSEPSGGGKYPRQFGKCKYEVEWPTMPWVYYIGSRTLVRYSDDSGLPSAAICEAWKRKDGGSEEEKAKSRKAKIIKEEEDRIANTLNDYE